MHRVSLAILVYSDPVKQSQVSGCQLTSNNPFTRVIKPVTQDMHRTFISSFSTIAHISYTKPCGSTYIQPQASHSQPRFKNINRHTTFLVCKADIPPVKAHFWRLDKSHPLSKTHSQYGATTCRKQKAKLRFEPESGNSKEGLPATDGSVWCEFLSQSFSGWTLRWELVSALGKDAISMCSYQV